MSHCLYFSLYTYLFVYAMFCHALGLFTFPALFPFLFSALLYLNGDFEGGEFIFTEMDAKTVTVRLSSKVPAHK